MYPIHDIVAVPQNMSAENSERAGFEKQKTKFFSRFAISHMDAMSMLQEGKVLGPGSEGWRNVSEHCLLGGVVANTLGKLVNLPNADLQEVTTAALTHDSRKRLEKEAARLDEKIQADGRVV